MTWPATPLKRVFASNTTGLWGEEAGVDAIDALCVRVADFDYSHLQVSSRADTLRSYSEGDLKNRRLASGDILIEKSGGGEKTPVGRAVRFELGPDIPAITSNFVGSLRTAPGHDSRYWTYVLASEYATRGTVPYIKQNTGIQNLDLPAYLSRRVVAPPASQQRAIADYLDHETAEIDSLVREQNHLVGLLSERSTSAVASVVTRGVSETQLVPTRLTWPDFAPQHWSVQRTSWVFDSIGSGTTPNSNDSGAFGGTIPWVTTSELRERGINETERQLNDGTLARYPALRVHPAGSLLIAMYGATIGRLGWLEVPSTVNQAVCVFSGYKAGPTRFAYYVLLASRSHLLTLASGGGQPNINQDKLRSLRIPIPPVEEQKQIVEHLDATLASSEQMELDAKRLIAIAKERRVALISAAVTGKIDVTQRHRPVAEQLEEEVLQKV